MSLSHSDLLDDLGRRETNRDRVLQALKQAGAKGCTNVELARPSLGGLRAVGRVNELVHDGWVIDVRRVGGGIWRYVLKGRKEPEQVELF